MAKIVIDLTTPEHAHIRNMSRKIIPIVRKPVTIVLKPVKQ